MRYMVFPTIRTTKLQVADLYLTPIGNINLGRTRQAHEAALITRSFSGSS